jgi:hypothetical protein
MLAALPDLLRNRRVDFSQESRYAVRCHHKKQSCDAKNPHIPAGRVQAALLCMTA